MNNLTDHDWEYRGIDGALENDGYIVLVVILGVLVVSISLYGADAFIEDVASVIYKVFY